MNASAASDQSSSDSMSQRVMQFIQELLKAFGLDPDSLGGMKPPAAGGSQGGGDGIDGTGFGNPNKHPTDNPTNNASPNEMPPPSFPSPMGNGAMPPGMGIDMGKPDSTPPMTASGGQSSYGAGPSKLIMSEAERNARYYEGGKPNAQSFFGNSTNVKSDVVVSDMISSVKNNWSSVDPTVRNLFESGQADSFFGNNKPAGFDKMKGWEKAALFEVGKASFETAGTFDPNHKDPGDQAWGALSLYNKNQSWKSYGLSGDLRGPEGKAALTSPGYGVIADLNTIPASISLQQGGNSFSAKMQPLDRAHFTFVDVNKGLGEYGRQKDMVLKNMFGGGAQDMQSRLSASSLLHFMKKSNT
jgi:hypothetical protein